MREEIRSFAPEVWALISNPMDGSVMGSVDVTVKSFLMGARWEGVDIVVGNTGDVWFLDHPAGAKRHDDGLDFLIRLAREKKKIMALSVTAGDTTTPWRVDVVLKANAACRDAGVLVYPNVQTRL